MLSVQWLSVCQITNIFHYSIYNFSYIMHMLVQLPYVLPPPPNIFKCSQGIINVCMQLCALLFFICLSYLSLVPKKNISFLVCCFCQTHSSVKILQGHKNSKKSQGLLLTRSWQHVGCSTQNPVSAPFLA